jgi:hypothetical protein
MLSPAHGYQSWIALTLNSLTKHIEAMSWAWSMSVWENKWMCTNHYGVKDSRSLSPSYWENSAQHIGSGEDVSAMVSVSRC